MTKARKQIIYMGTPAFAVPTLEMLAARDDVTIPLVVTQPDRPSGRGRKLASPPIADAARELQLPLLQTSTLRDPEIRKRLTELEPDLIVVAAFGLMLGRWVLDLPRFGCVNLHASILPDYRGANPIATAIAMGDSETGVSLMKMEAGLDTGPVYAVSTVPIDDSDTTASLTGKLATSAAALLADNLDGLLTGILAAASQSDPATLTRPLVKADGWVDWSRPAAEIARQVRAMWPWPRAWTTLPDGTQLQLHAVSVADERAGDRIPGTVLSGGIVATGEGSVRLDRIQLAGGRPLEGAAILSHRQLARGVPLGLVSVPEPPPLVSRPDGP